MNIQVTTKSVYCEVKIYPACNTSLLFARIAGTKTLTLDVLNTIKALGYDVVDVTKSALAA